jgi:hypothetical protein
MDSLLEKEIIEDAEVYCKEMNEGLENKEDKARNAKDEGQNNNTHIRLIREESNTTKESDCVYTKKTSNATHYSTTDKDARMSTKPGKPTQLNYLGQFSVDDAHHVITGAKADFADKRDSQCLLDILTQTIENLSGNDIAIEQVTADSNYNSGETLDFFIKNNIDAYTPNPSGYKPIREGFEYDEVNDRFLCTRGNKAILPFKGFKKKHKENDTKIYLSGGKDCRSCALRNECIGKGNIKKITCSIYKPLLDAMHEKMQTPYAKRLMKIRMKTVEPVLGTLINFRGMKRVNSRGIAQANKHVLMAAIAYNLMKYLKFIRMRAKVNVQILGQEVITSQNIAFARFIRPLWEYCVVMRFYLCKEFLFVPNKQINSFNLNIFKIKLRNSH